MAVRMYRRGCPPRWQAFSSCAVDQLGIFCIKLDAESWHILDRCRGYDRLWSLEITNDRDGLIFLGMVELLVSSKVARRLADATSELRRELTLCSAIPRRWRSRL